MTHKEVWPVADLTSVAKFVQDLQDFLQENQPYDGSFAVKDVLVTLEDEEKPKDEEKRAWGLISLDDREETMLQFEQGDFQIGPQ